MPSTPGTETVGERPAKVEVGMRFRENFDNSTPYTVTAVSDKGAQLEFDDGSPTHGYWYKLASVLADTYLGRAPSSTKEGPPRDGQRRRWNPGEGATYGADFTVRAVPNGLFVAEHAGGVLGCRVTAEYLEDHSTALDGRPPATAAAPAPAPCDRCGAPVVAGTAFCARCAAHRGATPAPPKPVKRKVAHDFSDPYCAIVANPEGGKIVTRCCKVCGDTEDDGNCLGAKDWRAHNEMLDRRLTDSRQEGPRRPLFPFTTDPQGAESHNLGAGIGVWNLRAAKRVEDARVVARFVDEWDLLPDAGR